MKKLPLAGLVLSLVLTTGVALAAASTWNDYRVDLVRCADTTTVCGSAITGTDPLSSGRVVLDSTTASLRLRGASPDTKYVLAFIELKNNGANISGPYGVANRVILGNVTTNHHGDATVKFAKQASVEPRLGFFFVGHADASGNQLNNEFVTGIDQVNPVN